MARERKQRIATGAGPDAWTSPFAALAPQAASQAPAGGTPPAREPAPSVNTRSERLLLRRSTAHRGGKTVLVLEGFSPAWNTARLEELLHQLKAALGCGGRLDGRLLEIQGEQADRLQPLLEARGFTVKRGW